MNLIEVRSTLHKIQQKCGCVDKMTNSYRYKSMFSWRNLCLECRDLWATDMFFSQEEDARKEIEMKTMQDYIQKSFA